MNEYHDACFIVLTLRRGTNVQRNTYQDHIFIHALHAVHKIKQLSIYSLDA